MGKHLRGGPIRLYRSKKCTSIAQITPSMKLYSCIVLLPYCRLLVRRSKNAMPTIQSHNCQGSIVYVQNVLAQWLRTRYTFFLNAQHMIEFVRSIIPFCLHSLEVARKLLVQ